jgi:hypothetical protein
VRYALYPLQYERVSAVFLVLAAGLINVAYLVWIPAGTLRKTIVAAAYNQTTMPYATYILGQFLFEVGAAVVRAGQNLLPPLPK